VTVGELLQESDVEAVAAGGTSEDGSDDAANPEEFSPVGGSAGRG
jgi:hypothetical protein